MKGFAVFAKSWIFVLILAASAFAQTEQTQNSAAAKVGVIDTTVFYDKEKGIKEIVDAQGELESEINPKKDELAVLEGEIKKLDKEIEKYRAAVKKFPQGDYMSFERMSERYEKLTAEYKQKEKQAKTFYDERKAEIFADVYQRVGDAIEQFAKEKGYALILDISKCDSCLPGNYDGRDYDEVTNEFIKYYNENYTKLKTE